MKSRRALFAGSVLTVAAVVSTATIAATVVSVAAADEIGPDADLLALRPLWLQEL